MHSKKPLIGQPHEGLSYSHIVHSMIARYLSLFAFAVLFQDRPQRALRRHALLVSARARMLVGASYVHVP